MSLAAASPDVWAIAGVVGCLVTLWQGWAFFRRSTASQREIRRVADEARTSVLKLEGLVEHSYKDVLELLHEAMATRSERPWPVSSHVEGRALDEPFRDARQEAIRVQLTNSIDRARRSGVTVVRADDLLRPLFHRFQAEDVHDALAALRSGGVIDWEGDGDWVEEPSVPIDLAPSASQRWLLAA
jgi:hypothetical protein